MSYRFVSVLLSLFFFQFMDAQQMYLKKNGRYDGVQQGVRIVGNCSNYLASGKFTYSESVGYDRNGNPIWKVVKICNYKKGILDGKYYEFEVNGDTVVVGAYKNDRKFGEWRMYSNKELSGRVTYDESGNGIGWQTFRREDKSMRKESYGPGGRNYQWNYTPKGNYSSRGELLGTEKDGTWFYYDSTEAAKDTMPVLSVQYKSQIKNGEEKKFHAGSVYSSSQFVNGQLHGSKKLYGPNMQVLCEEFYAEGKLNGKQTKYAHNGMQYSDWTYVNGNPEGICVVYDTISGTLTEEHSFEKGILITMKRFSVQHKLIAEQILLERDSLVYSFKEYHEDGTKKSTGRLIGTRRTGPYDSWHRNGKKNTTAFFRNDRYYNTITVWNEKGVKVFYAACSNGRVSEEEDVWSDGGAKLVFGTLSFERQRAKYAPTDLVLHYEDLYVMGDAVVNYVSPIGPWSTWTLGVDLGGHFIGTDDHTVPAFPGGPEAEVKFFEANLHYPEYELEEHISGKNVVTFTVRSDGSITAIDLVRSASPGLDAEALRIVKLMPAWKPATINGVAREGRCWLEFDWRIVERK